MKLRYAIPEVARAVHWTAGMRTPLLILSLIALPACVGEDLEVEDGEGAGFGGKADGGIEEGSAEAMGVLALVNDAGVDVEELDVAAGLSSRVAKNIVAARPFADLRALDAVPYVGPAALQQLVAYAEDTGRVVRGAQIGVTFSPQPAATAHTRQVEALIRTAQHTLDIAMYSFSDAGVSTALADATARGVEVRFLFETAAEDRKLADRTNTASARLERAGVDVRWVNKILHHKFLVVDGGTVVTGSANWSFGGAQVFDENTMFIAGSAELSSAYAREFDLLWTHSADFFLDAAQPASASPAIPEAADDPDLEALFTSANFDVAAGSTKFKLDRTRTRVEDALVAAIDGATRSIHIASGHLRLRSVADALIARKAAVPALDIKVYLDEQEYISASGDRAQQTDVDSCLATATTDAARWSCTTKDFLWGRRVGLGGIEVRYKIYSYRWDYSYAAQMHDKYVVIDGDELFSGSFNLSMNSEQATFENVVHLRGAKYASVIAQFEQDFARMWATGDGKLAALRTTIATASVIPMVFDAMALSWDEVTALKTLIRTNCAAADSTDFRANPASHKTCAR